MEIEANMFCLLLEINQLFEIKLLQKHWTAVLYFAKSLLFNFNFFTTLLYSVILQNWRGTHLWSNYRMSQYFDVVALNQSFYLH